MLTCTYAHGQAAIFIDVSAIHRGRVTDAAELHTRLAALGAVPANDAPTIVYVRSVDSRDSLSAGAPDRYRARIDLVASLASRYGAPEPIFVVEPWGTEGDRQAIGQALGREPSYFPATPEELEATGYGWLNTPTGFVVRRDDAGDISDLTGARQSVFGKEVIAPVDLILCADSEALTGWARSFKSQEATDASLGRFATSCFSAALTLPEQYMLPHDLLDAYGVADGWFAIFLPDAINSPVPVASALAAAQLALGQASTDIPLVTVATPTLSRDNEMYVSLKDHASMLEAAGVPVDLELSERMPEWLSEFPRHIRSTFLLLVDASGTVVESLAATPENPTGEPTLLNVLMRHDLF